MRVKITTLTENTVSAGTSLIGEHGLSLLIEAGERRILFDTGQGAALLRNAETLQIDLACVDTVVLSHGHYDHAGGLKSLLTRNARLTLIAHPAAWNPRLIRRQGRDVPIGVSEPLRMIEKSGVTLKLETGPVEIAPGILSTGEIPMTTDFESVEPVFWTGTDGGVRADDFADETALVLNTEKGTVVILGCAHRGLINTLRYAVCLTGNPNIYAIIGGLHLMSADTGKLQMICRSLHDFGVLQMIVGHCTGFQAMAALFNEFGEIVIPNTVGRVAEF